MGGTELLGEVGPLWERLNAHHKEHSPHFADYFAGRVFSDRLKAWVDDEKTDCHVDLATDAESGQAIGYCVSTVDRQRVGEIESLYVEHDYRKQGIGEELMRRAIAWLDEKNVAQKHIAVAAGNEQAIAFYNRFGFYTRRLVLEQKEHK